MSDFWVRKLGQQQAPPPHITQPVVPTPATPGAWWQAPAVQQGLPTHQQMPGDSGFTGMTQQETYQTLKGMRASDMSQDQMEALALMELQEAKYQGRCPNCQSENFLPRGTRVGSSKMGTDKCFDCGASSSTLTQSPEAAPAGRSNTAGTRSRQVGGGQGNYGRHHTELPVQYLPRNA